MGRNKAKSHKYVEQKSKRARKRAQSTTAESMKTDNSPDDLFERKKRAELLSGKVKKGVKRLLGILNSVQSLRSDILDLPQLCGAVADVAAAARMADAGLSDRGSTRYPKDVEEMFTHANAVVGKTLEAMNVLESEPTKPHEARIKQEVLDLIYSALPNPSPSGKRSLVSFVTKQLAESSQPCRSLLPALRAAMRRCGYSTKSAAQRKRKALLRQGRTAHSQRAAEASQELADLNDIANNTAASETVGTVNADQAIVPALVDQAEMNVEPGIEEEHSSRQRAEMYESLEELVQHNIHVHINAAEHSTNRAIQLQTLRNVLAVFRGKFLTPACGLPEDVKAVTRLTCLEITAYVESQLEILYCSERESDILQSALTRPIWTPDQIKNYNLKRLKSLVEQVETDERVRSEMFSALQYCLRAQVPLTDADLVSAMQELTRFAQNLPFNVDSQTSSYAVVADAVYTPLVGLVPSGMAPTPVHVRVKAEPRDA